MDNNVVLLDADFCSIILKNPNNISYFESIFEILDITQLYILMFLIMNCLAIYILNL